MKSLFVVLLLLCTLAFVNASQILDSAKPYSDAEISRLWTTFTRTHEKMYGSVEGARRHRFFKDNVERVRLLNAELAAAGSERVYGLSRFMDLTPEEFQRTYMMPERSVEQLRSVQRPQQLQSVPLRDLPESWNWNEKGAVTPVKNQGSCGSCWAFSTTGNLEGTWFVKKGELLSLSEQSLVDCDHECDPKAPKDCDAGCNGGLMLNALEHVRKHGIPLEKDYTYTAHGGACRNVTVSPVTITGSVQLPTDETQIAQYLVDNGPLAVALNAQWLQFYVGGISDPLTCNPKSLNHGVLMVGYGNASGKDYWLVKNSWGSGWGEKGYFRMRRGRGVCGINTYVVSPTF